MTFSSSSSSSSYCGHFLFLFLLVSVQRSATAYRRYYYYYYSFKWIKDIRRKYLVLSKGPPSFFFLFFIYLQSTLGSLVDVDASCLAATPRRTTLAAAPNLQDYIGLVLSLIQHPSQPPICSEAALVIIILSCAVRESLKI